MELQNKTLIASLVKEIEGLYKFAGHELAKDQVIEMATLITERYGDMTLDKFSKFVRSCKLGYRGVIQRNPTSFMIMVKDEFAKML